ncbi:MAG: HlyC/CorC family transporter [Bradyrhizobiaceae bacterium]|nr:HlyC/CorC family transporter [Bradyrhizobiaceae bacterium]
MLFIEIIVVLLLILVNGLLAMSELAIVSSRPGRLKAMVDREVHGSRRALELASDPGRFLSAVQIGITLVGILAGAFSGATLGIRLADWLVEWGVSGRLANVVAVGLVVTAITYLSLIGGELVPKRVALRDPERVACLVAPGMTLLARIGAPLVWLLDVSSKAVLNLFGLGQEGEARVTEEEIRALVAEAESAGVLEPEERAMISGVMRLADRPAKAVMTPRLEVDYIDLTDDDETIRKDLAESVHSRLPVCEGSLDEVIGVIQVKDLANAYMRGEEVNVRNLVRQAPMIPDTVSALDVIERFKESAVHMGIVLDEYGNFEGIVTAADLLEAIAGEFAEAEGPAEPDYVRRQDGSYIVSGSMPADELADLLHTKLPKERDYHTVAGQVLAAFGRLPEVGETVESGGLRFEVLDLDGRRIDKVVVAKVPRRRRAKS